jgi:tol-pal system protein YbgF
LKRIYAIKLLIFCSLAALLISCAPNKEIILIKQDIASLKSELSSMQADKEDILKQLAILQKRQEQELSQFQQTQADMGLKIDEVTTEIQILNEKLEDTNFRISSLSQQLSGLRLMERQPIYERKQNTEPEEEEQTPDEAAANTLAKATSPKEIYDTAHADFLKGNYDLAIQGFKQYCELYPNSALAGNAQYWIAECYYSQQKFAQAAEEFDKVINNYPKSDKVIGAQLKKAFAYFELNQIGRAVIQLQQLIQEYPKSNEARIARERLKSLGLDVEP